MAWSTKQLADLTGVTVRSIRHWHQIGLLPEPERLTNGYKQYAAQHLVLALRIARLATYGFSLEQIANMLESVEQSHESLRTLGVELDRRIDELVRLRAEVRELLEHGISPDLSPEALLTLEALGADPGSRNVAILLSRIIVKDDVHALASIMRDAPASLKELNETLLQLSPTASDDQIIELAEHGATLIGDYLKEQGDLVVRFDSRVGEEIGAAATSSLMNEHLNPAQQRAMNLILERLEQL